MQRCGAREDIAHLDEARLEFDSFRGISDSKAVRFRLQVGLCRGTRSVTRPRALAGKADGGVARTWALLDQKVGSLPFSAMAWLYKSIAVGQSCAAKALLPWFLRSVAFSSGVAIVSDKKVLPGGWEHA